MNLSKSKHYAQLHKLAKKAPQLNKRKIFSPERIAKYNLQALNLKLLYASERVDEDILSELFSLAKETESQKKMTAMQRMEIVNFIADAESENRRVGHVAARHLFDENYSSEEEKEAVLLAKAEVEKLENFLKTQDLNAIQSVVVIGIGGSFLGTQAIWEALKSYKKTDRQLYFISNVDPDNLAEVLTKIELSTSLILVVSKSGDTMEVRTNEELLRRLFRLTSLDPSKHFIAITAKGSPLDTEDDFLASFYLWDFIGGRYSISSMVGLVPLALTLGMSVVEEFLLGMSEMDRHVLSASAEENLPLNIALLSIWNSVFLGIPSLAVIPYASSLARYPAHLQQLFMESNGKSISQKGKPLDYPSSVIYWGEPGTDAQHSFFQFLHQGTQITAVEFIAFLKSQAGMDEEIGGSLSQEKLLANMLAQSLSLCLGKSDSNLNKNFDGNRPSRILLAEKLDARTMGQLLATHEHVAVYIGALLGINSFDQEGVQLGKSIALKFIELFQNKRLNKEQASSSDDAAALALFEQLKI